MRALVDTHCLLWWLSDPDVLNDRVKEIFLSTDHELLLSAVVSWELTIKASLGRLALPKKPRQIFQELLEDDGFTSLPIEHSHTLNTADLPWYHNDPFDRLLISQAQMERVPVLTADGEFKKYDIEVIWAK